MAESDTLFNLVTDNTTKIIFYDREILEDNSLGEPTNISQSILFGDRISIDTALIACNGSSNYVRLQEYKEQGFNWVCLLQRGTFLPMKDNDITFSEYKNIRVMDARDKFSKDTIGKIIDSVFTKLNELMLSGKLTPEEQEKIIDEIMNLNMMYGMMSEVLPTSPTIK